MGNCGSKPPVADDVKPPAKVVPPPVPRVVQQVPVQKAEPVPEPTNPSTTEENRALGQPRKTKSMEMPASLKPVEDDDKDSDEDEKDGEWKVRRRVSRRLSLEVHKKPGSKTGSPSPGFGPAPTAEEQATWDVAANADLMGPVAVMTYSPSLSKPGQDFDSGLHAGAAGEHAQSKTAAPGPLQSVKSVGERSRLGPGYAAATVSYDGSDDESQEAREEMPGPWRARRRGRRLSLEVEKAPDLALLAALRRSSSAPLEGEYARMAVQDDKDQQQKQAEFLQRMAPAPVKVFTAPGSRGSGESAVTSPAAHSARVIDFAQKLSVDVDNGAQDGDEQGGKVLPPSVIAAEVLSQEKPEGSPDLFRVRRRKSRRLSLEIEKQPDEAVLAAVRRTHSAPITAAAAQAAMGDAAWAAALAGQGHAASGSESPSFQPAAVSRGADARDRATPGGDLVPSGARVATSAQEARANAWGSVKVIDFASGGGEDEDDDDESTPREGGAGSGANYVRVNPRGTSRRRSMDIYKKAVDSGKSHDAAAAMARQYDPAFTSYESAAAAEEADLLSPGDADSTKDFSTWSESAAQPTKSAYKKRWADYSAPDTAEPETAGSKRHPDLSAFGPSSQPGAPSPLSGISV